MVTNFDGAEDFRPGTNIYMSADLRRTARPASTDSHLLENQAVGAYQRIGMNNNAIGMGQQKSPGDLRAQWNIRAGNHAPETMPQHRPFF